MQEDAPPSESGAKAIEVTHSGERVDAFLAGALKITRSRVSKALKAGTVTIDGKPCKVKGDEMLLPCSSPSTGQY